MGTSFFGGDEEPLQVKPKDRVFVLYESVVRLQGTVLEVADGRCLVKFDQPIVVIEKTRDSFCFFLGAAGSATPKLVTEEWVSVILVSPIQR